MIRKITDQAWRQYKALLSQSRERYVPALPLNLPFQGKIEGSFDYVLPDKVLARLREWLRSRGEESVYYFKTEAVEGEETNFEVETAELTHDDLSILDVHGENVIVGKDFSWAVFVDHEGALHVSGPQELMQKLSA